MPADDAVHSSTRRRLVDLYEESVDDLYRYCFARCGDDSLAEDATAEAFLAAARAFATGVGHEVDRPWLFVVARRRLIDGWRAAERRRRRAERLASWTPRDADTDLSDGLASTDSVVRAIQSLPLRQRQALTLRYLDEQSTAEIAQTMEIHYQAAESLLARARRSFSTAWTEAQTTGEDAR